MRDIGVYTELFIYYRKYTRNNDNDNVRRKAQTKLITEITEIKAAIPAPAMMIMMMTKIGIEFNIFFFCINLYNLVQ